MVLEEFLLVLEGLRDGTLVVDIALSTVDDGDVSEAERDDTASENVNDVRPLVPGSTSSSVELVHEKDGRDEHQIDLGQDSNRTRTLRIAVPRHLESIRVGEIRVGGGDGEDDRVGLHDEFEQHLSDLTLNITRLVSDWDL